jgi:hypothetical protein
MGFYKILYKGVLLEFVNTFKLCLKLDNTGHFTWRLTCISVHGSDWAENPQPTLVTVTWGIPSQLPNHIGKSSMMTSSTRHHAHSTPDNSDITGTFAKAKGHTHTFPNLLYICVKLFASALCFKIHYVLFSMQDSHTQNKEHTNKCILIFLYFCVKQTMRNVLI